jgi:hypothetical protein
MANSHTPQIIEISIRELSQLFDPFDPSPLPERDLNPRAEEFIVGWAGEFHRESLLNIVIYMPETEVRRVVDHDLAAGLKNYFAGQALTLDRELRELFRIGWRYLSIGLPILLICFLASQLVRTGLGPGPFAGALGESLIILGWVANWKPMETFLYDWWPLRRRRDLYQRLSNAEISVRSK